MKIRIYLPAPASVPDYCVVAQGSVDIWHRRYSILSGNPGSNDISLIVGIISALIFGVGMCCTMVWADTFFIPGIIIGVIGLIGVIAAYPLYVRVTKKQREKLAPEILRLSNELMK